MKRNGSLKQFCDEMKENSLCKNKTVTIVWKMEGSKDRSVDVDGHPIFHQKLSDLTGTFDSQFRDLCFWKIWGGHHLSHCHANAFVIDDAAPLGSARQTSMIFRDHRIRRRGPRSVLAMLRRSVLKCRRTLPDISPGESGEFISEIDIHNESQCNTLHKCMPDLAG